MGLGQGGGFALGLVMLVDYAPSPAASARLSALVFLVSYSIASLGPLVFGAVHDATDGFTAPYALLLFVLGQLVLVPRLRPGRRPSRPTAPPRKVTADRRKTDRTGSANPASLGNGSPPGLAPRATAAEVGLTFSRKQEESMNKAWAVPAAVLSSDRRRVDLSRHRVGCDADADVADFTADTTGAKANGFSSAGVPQVTFYDTGAAGLSVGDFGNRSHGNAISVSGAASRALEIRLSALTDSLTVAFGNDDPALSTTSDFAQLTLFNGLTRVAGTASTSMPTAQWMRTSTRPARRCSTGRRSSTSTP